MPDPAPSGARSQAASRWRPVSLWAGAAGVATLWLALPLAMARTGLDPGGPRTLSEMGLDPAGRDLFRGALLLSAGLFLVSMLGPGRWSAGSPAYRAVAAGAMAAQAVVALVPLEGAGATHEVHVVAGLLLGLALPVVIGLHGRVVAPPRRRAARGLTAASVVASLAGVGLSTAGRGALAEVVPAAAFHAWILTAGWWAATAQRAVHRADPGT